MVGLLGYTIPPTTTTIYETEKTTLSNWGVADEHILNRRCTD